MSAKALIEYAEQVDLAGKHTLSPEDFLEVKAFTLLEWLHGQGVNAVESYREVLEAHRASMAILVVRREKAEIAERLSMGVPV